jgi:hypothetical protein
MPRKVVQDGMVLQRFLISTALSLQVTNASARLIIPGVTEISGLQPGFLVGPQKDENGVN